MGTFGHFLFCYNLDMSKTKATPITPVFDENRNRWRLSIPKKYSHSGKRERKFFKTKGQAEIEAERLKAMLLQWGSQSRKIPADVAQDALRAQQSAKGCALHCSDATDDTPCAASPREAASVL